MIIKRRDIATLQEIRQYIEDNFYRDIPIAAICKEFGLNRTKLQEGFNQLFDSSVHALISRRRMEKAKEMLRETDEPVKNIAVECGYKTLSSFTRVFTRLHNMSPTRYRTLGYDKDIPSEKMGASVNES
jgi:AraC-like DNA-binding protein